MRYNIAFSSSGVRFAAHIGVLAYLQDNSINIQNYSGTSGGAIVAAWGANNLPARELLSLTLQFGSPKFFTKPFFGLGGILDHSFLGNIISRYCVPVKNLWIATFNILKMKKEIWNGVTYNLSKILTATTCIPGLFRPIIYSNGLHIDGLFGSFCPDDLWNEGVTLSVKLKAKNKTKNRYPLDGFLYKIEQSTIEILESIQNIKNKDNIIYINPDVSSIAQTDLFLVKAEDHIELFKKGYQCAEEVLKKEHSSSLY